MKKNTIYRLRSLYFIISFLGFASMLFAAGGPTREYYQLTVYHYNTAAQGNVLNDYAEKALLPALHRMGIKHIGVFAAIANDTAADKRLYMLLPVKSPDELITIAQKLDKDTAYQTAGTAYINALYTASPFTRKEIILTEAFSLAPKLKLPQLNSDKNIRVYELRSYESATEKIFTNKVHMFNEGGEIDLFSRLNFNAVFYSSVIAGDKMPNLMYMTCFENMEERNKHWKAFVDDPFWKKISTMPEYQNNVSHIDITFLGPTSYSDY